MLVTYAVAGAVASASALVAAQHRAMPFWWRWDPAWVVTLLIPVALVFAIGGVAVAGLLEHLNGPTVIEEGSGKAWADGAEYGLAAFVLLRLEFNGVGFEALSPARNFLTLYGKRAVPSLHRASRRSIERKVGDLIPVALVVTALDLCDKHVAGALSPGDFAVHRAWLDDVCVRALAKASRDQPDALHRALSARTELRRYCIELIVAGEDWSVPLSDGVPAAA
ncbi:MAG: hypothetical protein JWR63_995 [Conexibacter sp.]|nr:hypothetical protein [Conexibacter sp.]